MFRKIAIGSFVSFILTGAVMAEPQTVSYYSGQCVSQVCDFVPAVPPQGFVLTDILHGAQPSLGITIREVSGNDVADKLSLYTGADPMNFKSGIPFTGGTGIRVVVTDNASINLLKLTLAGYIPGTSASSVPAVSGLGLTVFALLILAVGGYLLRKRAVGMETLAA